MKIILDFDDTIINTHRLMWEFLEILKEFDFTEEEFFGAYQKCKRKVGDFNSGIMIGLLSEIRPFDKIKVEERLNLILDDLEDLVYPDFFDFVNNFDKKDLILLSFGITDMQKIKIDNSKITKFFGNVIITSRDKTEDIKPIFKKNKEEKIFFIDDKTIQVDNMKSKFPEIITMEIKRPQGSDITTESKSVDYKIKDLFEAKNIINELNNG